MKQFMVGKHVFKAICWSWSSITPKKCPNLLKEPISPWQIGHPLLLPWHPQQKVAFWKSPYWPLSGNSRTVCLLLDLTEYV